MSHTTKTPIQKFLPSDARYSMLVWSKKYPCHVRDLDVYQYHHMLNHGYKEEVACLRATIHGFYLMLEITENKYYYITYSDEFDEYQYQILEINPESREVRRVSGEKYCMNLTKRSGWMPLPEEE